MKAAVFFFYVTGIFFAGATAVANLSLLVGTNPHYEAHWWKVAMSLAVAVILAVVMFYDREGG